MVMLLELLDEVAMMACNRYSAVDQREAPTLFIELHGTANTVDAAGAAVGQCHKWDISI